MNLTFEQGAVVANPSPHLVVKAYAGTGKTSTLVQYATKRPNKRVLYLAFNKAVQLEAERKFSSNVRCLTTHALAYRAVGHAYKHKLGSLRAFEVSRLAGVADFKVCKDALDAVSTWCCSSDPALDLSHVVMHTRTDGKTSAADQVRRADVFALAKRIWANMQSDDPQWRMPHDGYLKLYQLTQPDLSRQYDILLFDECQDANPVTTAIVMGQRRCGVVMVGDPHQSIYQFRGARNAIEQAPANWPVLNLTRSFRFGPEVAEIANVLLAAKGERTKIVGAGGLPPEALRDGREAVFRPDLTRQFTFIARTNASLVGQAIASRDKSLAWVGGVASYPLDRVLDVHALKTGNRGAIRDPSVSAFSSYSELSTYSDLVEDVELRVLRKLVDEFREDLPALVADVRRRSVDDESQAQVVLSTAHRCKGLEWHQVVLADDFLDLDNEAEEASKAGLSLPLTAKGMEEINTLYVATTRALQRVALPASVLRHFADRHDLADNPVVQAALGRAALPPAQAVQQGIPLRRRVA